MATCKSKTLRVVLGLQLLCVRSTSDWSAAFAAVVDNGLGVLVDHGAAVRAPAEPHLDLPRLHRRRGVSTEGSGET